MLTTEKATTFISRRNQGVYKTYMGNASMHTHVINKHVLYIATAFSHNSLGLENGPDHPFHCSLSLGNDLDCLSHQHSQPWKGPSPFLPARLERLKNPIHFEQTVYPSLTPSHPGSSSGGEKEEQEMAANVNLSMRRGSSYTSQGISYGVLRDEARRRLCPNDRAMLDSAAEGPLIDKTPAQATTLIATMAAQTQQFGTQSQSSHKVNEIAKLINLVRKQLFKNNRCGKKALEEPLVTKKARLLEEDKAIASNEQGFPSSQSMQPMPFNSNVYSEILISTNVPSVPFPHKFAKSKDEHENFIMDTVHKVQVNIPIHDAIKQVQTYAKFLKDLFLQRESKQVPTYAKFLKDLCITKRKCQQGETVNVSENVSAALQRKLPLKCKDPALSLGDLKYDGIIIQLVGRSNVYPKDLLEVVLVQVGEFIFYADFYVLEIEEESPFNDAMPLLLSR
ncbi:hypothetical protein D8674_017622 [Pyrus ussuriensis x Pyrus communis]|uniref:Uncharacterized protein n=1 Tax=Pyrus ussuriensis x Pyrus communis TaxID=2448454 RepID=A0A5N5HIL1_9ROSA|nr:hypothetical protein D8674_017622 [Pyrus ussuriensis x Pyrus communis]